MKTVIKRMIVVVVLLTIVTNPSYVTICNESLQKQLSAIGASRNFKSVDGLNISSVNIRYDPSIGNLFTYEVRGYFYDTNPPYANSETSIVNIKYLNFTSSDHEFLTNGSEYINSAFFATVFDGVTAPDIMIYPDQNPIVVFFNQTFTLRFELSVAIANPVPITIQLTAFNNATDSVSLTDTIYPITYYMKTDILINSQQFNKDNIIVKVNGSQVDPNNVYVMSKTFDVKIYDKTLNLLYHDPSCHWAASVIIDFTSARIENDYYSSILASLAPISVIDPAFYQSSLSNFSDSKQRFIESGAFGNIYQGSMLYYGNDRKRTFNALPTDSPVDRSWVTNIYDTNDTAMPTSMIFNASRYEYPWFYLSSPNVVFPMELLSLWIRTPPNDNASMILLPFYSSYDSSNPANDALLVIGIFNGSIWNMTRLFQDNFSLVNCTKLSPMAGNTWYNIAIFLGNATMNATIFVDAKMVAALNDSYESASTGVTIYALNYTTMSEIGVGGFVISGVTLPSYELNATTALKSTFYLANLWFKQSGESPEFVGDVISNGQSLINYANSTAFKLNVKTRGDFYNALSVPINAVMLDDFMNFMYIPAKVPYINETPFSFNYLTVEFSTCYFIPDFLGHGNPINLTNGSSIIIYTDISAFGGPLQTYENQTFEFWVYTAGSRGFNDVQLTSSGNNKYLNLRFNATDNTMKITEGIIENSVVNITINPAIWNHVRIDSTIKNGSLANRLTTIYVNDPIVASFNIFPYDTGFTSFTSNSPAFFNDSLCIDAIGFWRSSWIGNPSLSRLYSVGDNLKLICAAYPNGQFTFDSSSVGSSISTVNPAFVMDTRSSIVSKNIGNISRFDTVHENVYDLQRTPQWASLFSKDFPIVAFNEYLLPNGYGYESRGRVSFWFYANSSGGASKYIFAIYDDGGTKTNSLDDKINAFVIGSAFDDSNSSSIVAYFTKKNGINYIRQTNYSVINDTWNYFVFEWNSTGNTLWINQQLIFHGLTATISDTNTVVYEYSSFKSLGTLLWTYLESKNALEYFTSNIELANRELIKTSSARTAFLFNSGPYIAYVTNTSKIGATWYTSFGHLDNLGFEYDVTRPHDYIPAMASIIDQTSNFTAQTSLTYQFPLSMWNDISLYQGANYNISFVINVTFGSYPLQVFGDANQYIVFVFTKRYSVSIIMPIDISKSVFTVKLWSINGTYSIQNFSIGLTSRNPQNIDAFKKYMHDNAVFSRYIGMNQQVSFNITAGTYYLLAETIPTMDAADFDRVTIDGGSNAINVLPPSLRDITIAYSDQRGQPITNIRTYLLLGDVFVLQPSNVFQAEIGSTLTITSRNVFNEVVFYGTYKVLSFSNYLNIIVVVHSLEIYNQDEYFANYTITKLFAPGFYWSRYLYPKTGAEEKLTTGTYTIAVRDHFNSMTTYHFNLFGDDYLLITSDLTIQNAINNIVNVNRTIGNQITNVELNITNQNSQINNSIVNVDISITSMNTTLGTQLLTMNAGVISVNSTINQQTLYITSLMANLNSTINSQTTYIQSLIANVNSTINAQTTYMTTLFTNINSTILQQSANLEQYLININNTINSIDVNLTQTFFTDLMNNQTGQLTGYITSTVNNQTTTITYQINNETAYINSQLLNVNNSIISNTISINGSMNFQFNEVKSSNSEIQNLIQRTSYSTLINWSEDVQITGIIELTLTNSYPFPILFELKRGTKVQNFTIYTENFVKTYVPGGLYQYRMRNADNGTFVRHRENESSSLAATFANFFVSNNSNYISTSFARVPTPITVTATGNDWANIIVVFVFIGVITLIVFLVWRERKTSVGGKDITGAINDKPRKSGKKGKSTPVSSSATPSGRRTRPATEVGGVRHGKASNQASIMRNDAPKRRGIL